jgi:acetylornithine deacetylase/succinyl-diaminopimelate desuccinylase-like protein
LFPQVPDLGGNFVHSIHYFRESLDAYTFNFGWTAMDENLHAPNEFIRVRNFEQGQRAYCLILEKLASQPLTT